MESFVRWVLEIVIVIGLIVVAVSVGRFTPAPPLLVALVLGLSLVLAHVVFDHYTQEKR